MSEHPTGLVLLLSAVASPPLSFSLLDNLNLHLSSLSSVSPNVEPDMPGSFLP